MAFPGTYNFNYYRGDTFQFVIRPKTSNGGTFALDDYSGNAIFTISTDRGAAGVSNQIEATAVIDTSEDIITCTIEPDQGRQLEGGTSYVYDVQIDNGADVIYTLLTGTITVTDDITGALP